MINKKKIVIVISIISIMILCFSISSFAYENGDVLPAGTVIHFKDELNLNNGAVGNMVISFTSNGISYSRMNVFSSSIEYYSGSGTTVYRNGNWINDNYKTIIINNEITVNSSFAQFLNDNEIDPPPHLEPSFWETVSGFFSEALASGTAIVNWMTITPIALIPLALYCLIVIIAITKRMIKG